MTRYIYNVCCKCGHKIRLARGKLIAPVWESKMAEADNAVCRTCIPQSEWRRYDEEE